MCDFCTVLFSSPPYQRVEKSNLSHSGCICIDSIDSEARLAEEEDEDDD